MPSFTRRKSEVCCEDCFVDPVLRMLMRRVKNKKYCGYCQKKSEHCADPSALAENFVTVARLYERVDEVIAPSHIRDEGIDFFGEPLIEQIQRDWELFSSDDSRVWEDIFSSAVGSERGEQSDLDPETYVLVPHEFYEEEENRRDAIKSQWDEFCWEIKHSNRFLFSKSIDWLDTLLEGTRSSVGQTKTTFYRARIVGKQEKFSEKKIGPPPPHLAKPGRGNPEGIPYFYLADSPHTALAEVRPQIGDRVWIAKFEAKGRLDIVDLRTGQVRSPFRYKLKDLPEMVKKIFLLKHLSDDLSRPVSPKAASLDYLPTQYLCELIKNRKYKGIRYKSAVNSESNLLTFSDKDFQFVTHQDVRYKPKMKIKPF